MNKSLRLHNKLLLFLEHGEKRLDELVHQGDHCLPMGESLISLLVVEGLEVGVAADESHSHKVEVLAQGGIAMLGDPSPFGDCPRLVDPRVCATEGNEILVPLEAVDGANLGKEVGGGGFPYTVDAGDDVHLLTLRLPDDGNQLFGEPVELAVQEQEALSTVGDKRAVRGQSDRIGGKFPQLGNSERDASSPLSLEGLLQLLVGGFLNGGRTWKATQQPEHSHSKYIKGKDFRECYGKVRFQLGLGLGNLLGYLLPSSCDAQSLVVHGSPGVVHRRCTALCEACDGPGVDLVGLGLPQGVGLAELLDQHRVNDKRLVPFFQEKVGQGDVVAAGRLHDKPRSIRATRLGKQRLKALSGHGKRTVDPLLVPCSNQVERRTLLRNVNADDIAHHRTSLDGVERQVPNPISRLTQALWLNQPIGVLGTGGQTPLEAQRLNENVALTAPNYNIFKNLANYSFINT